jgi:diphthamide synthase (EF-2-diphthine--ammonia ligase)
MTKEKKYNLKPLVWMVKDEDSVKFHVANSDYFGTIATVIKLLKSETDRQPHENQEVINQAFSNLEKDLMFLQEKYKIVEK